MKKSSELKTRLQLIQEALNAYLSNTALKEKERKIVMEYHEATRIEELFLKEKSKIQWLKEGYSNTAYFHRAVKIRQCKNHIVRIRQANEYWVEELNKNADEGDSFKIS
ncbi:hypothetical protein CFOL_v3_08147 [Cephalotus follicularis]|uniref:Uncharacterized protein n=1 Tax=Cephalotus follicularis TaxID=3775 RepID=A0A1Q3B9P5_CEPFO|nr:hypothetical protein CFOL_v3_08147 [Cephalotus follicularis]